jgi:anti-anti-sigma factor
MAELRLQGEVDLTNRETFEAAVERMTNIGGDLVIDLSELTFIDAAGLRALAQAAYRTDGEGRLLRLHRPSPHVRRLLRLVGLGHLTG